jgi:hypothetical protein
MNESGVIRTQVGDAKYVRNACSARDIFYGTTVTVTVIVD